MCVNEGSRVEEGLFRRCKWTPGMRSSIREIKKWSTFGTLSLYKVMSCKTNLGINSLKRKLINIFMALYPPFKLRAVWKSTKTDFKKTGIFVSLLFPMRGKKRRPSVGLSPWTEVNSSCPLVISVTVGVAPWTLGGEVYRFQATIHKFTIESSQLVSGKGGDNTKSAGGAKCSGNAKQQKRTRTETVECSLVANSSA